MRCSSLIPGPSPRGRREIRGANGYEPFTRLWDGTRNITFLRHARIPIPPAGHENKKPGDLSVQPGLFEEADDVRRYASPRAWVARARASRGCAMNRDSLAGLTHMDASSSQARRAMLSFSRRCRISALYRKSLVVCVTLFSHKR